jgi:hypothetical protein
MLPRLCRAAERKAITIELTQRHNQPPPALSGGFPLRQEWQHPHCSPWEHPGREGLPAGPRLHLGRPWRLGLAERAGSRPVGWAQIVTSRYSGLLLVFFSSLRSQFLQPKSRRVAGILLTGLAIGWMLAAFPEDGPPFGEPITAGHLHGAGFVCIVLFGMTGIVATAVALRRNVAWRGYSAISVIAAFFFQFVLAFHQAPAMTSCATSKDMRGLEILNHRDRGARQSFGLCALACTPAVRCRRPSPALHARRRARHRIRPGPYSTGPLVTLAAMPTVI